MTDVTIISYLLPPNLSFQQSREEPDKRFQRQRGVPRTIGGSVLPQKAATVSSSCLNPVLAEEGLRLFCGFN